MDRCFIATKVGISSARKKKGLARVNVTPHASIFGVHLCMGSSSVVLRDLETPGIG